MTFGRERAGNALSPTQRSALVSLGQGALPWINRAFGRKRACPSTWISFNTASALVREGLATISVSGCGSWLRLTPAAASMPRRWLNWLKRRIVSSGSR